MRSASSWACCRREIKAWARTARARLAAKPTSRMSGSVSRTARRSARGAPPATSTVHTRWPKRTKAVW